MDYPYIYISQVFRQAKNAQKYTATYHESRPTTRFWQMVVTLIGILKPSAFVNSREVPLCKLICFCHCWLEIACRKSENIHCVNYVHIWMLLYMYFLYQNEMKCWPNGWCAKSNPVQLFAHAQTFLHQNLSLHQTWLSQEVGSTVKTMRSPIT